MRKVLVVAGLVTLSMGAPPLHAGGRSHKGAKGATRGVTLVIVVDRSGSMSGSKIAQTRQAAAAGQASVCRKELSLLGR